MKSPEYVGPMFVGRCRLRHRWRGICIALRVLWNALRGYELAGYQYEGELRNTTPLFRVTLREGSHRPPRIVDNPED